jgi:hypothetical protein
LTGLSAARIVEAGFSRIWKCLCVVV